MDCGVRCRSRVRLGRRRCGWARRLLALLAVVAVLCICLVKINSFYGYRPTIASALGQPAGNQIDL